VLVGMHDAGEQRSGGGGVLAEQATFIRGSQFVTTSPRGGGGAADGY